MPPPVLLYWPNEVTGRLAKHVEDLINKQPLDSVAIDGLKTYFSHWANYPLWIVPEEQQHQLDKVRSSILEAKTREDLDKWLDDALKLGIDPL